MNQQKVAVASIILRLGLAFVFFFAAATSLLDPQSYYKFIPSIVTQVVPGTVFLMAYGIFEIALGLWLLSGKGSFYSGMLAALLLFTLTFFNLQEINIFFKMVALFFAPLPLVALSGDWLLIIPCLNNLFFSK